ncbi:MAG: hypothetical protein JO171_13850 [Paludibacterium sp.]|uniref:hypothetical protein n=1 Tax=Paludibacterium sp. TaxID=1917523 RepID=UPI0025D8DCCB|nr:hypothetical protein [Paludibacterium sp.]MBV8048239.1 hypothetical protein [Paludibacterium sp.]MBV8646798.1 hypothetical protein [Paludibacterium sp.]
MSTISQIAQQTLALSAYQNGGTQPSLVNSGATASMATEAAQLSAQANDVVLLTGGQSSDASLYNAAGLLNNLSAAGTLQGSLLSTSGTSAQQSTDQGVISATLGDVSGTTSGLLSATLGSTPATLNSAWSSVLQNNPSLAGDAASALTTGGIVNTLA